VSDVKDVSGIVVGSKHYGIVGLILAQYHVGGVNLVKKHLLVLVFLIWTDC
jgi:hypothetical protein